MGLSNKTHRTLQEVIAWGGAATAMGALYYIIYGRIILNQLVSNTE